MASVRLNITDIENPAKVFQQPACKGALTKLAGEIADKANAMSAGFRTGLFYPDNDRTKDPVDGIGNQRPKYKTLKAINCKDGAVALVVTGNYAAMKECHEHNTLAKARG